MITKITFCQNKIISQIKFLFSNLNVKIDKSQIESLKEKLILVDKKDNKIGNINKLDAHLIEKKNKYPHRAFSVFLFDKNNKMLIQQRSIKKVTFPLLWSNTCCSHPLDISNENTFDNIKNAVVRRMKFELGLNTKVDLYHLYGRILYKAPSNKIFEEFELDYIFLAKIFDKDFNKRFMKSIINKDEVKNIRFKSVDLILNDMKKNPKKYTPWFKMIMNKKGKEIEMFGNNLDKLVYKEDIINFI
jgi:isopentenyl-diphosphate delta-isomerase